MDDVHEYYYYRRGDEPGAGAEVVAKDDGRDGRQLARRRRPDEAGVEMRPHDGHRRAVAEGDAGATHVGRRRHRR